MWKVTYTSCWKMEHCVKTKCEWLHANYYLPSTTSIQIEYYIEILNPKTYY